MIYESNFLKLIINIISRYRLRAICGLATCTEDFINHIVGHRQPAANDLDQSYYLFM